MAQKTEKITIRLPARYLEALDYLVALDDFSSRSEAIKTSVRDMIYERLDVVVEKVRKMETFEEKMEILSRMERQFLRK